MTDDSGFWSAYHDLEVRMRLLAQADGDVYLPNPEPRGLVDYVFVCMEPSLGRGTPDKVKADVEAGHRNFVNSIEDFLLHFSIRQYLCKPGELYHVTDWSKGAMAVKRAGVEREKRYDRWYPLLLEEIDLVGPPNARVYAVGGDVSSHLARRQFPRNVTQIMHYSPLAGAARALGVVGFEEGFEKFRSSVSLDLILSTAEQVLNESVPVSIKDATLARLAARHLSESRLQLIFNYKLAFEGFNEPTP